MWVWAAPLNNIIGVEIALLFNLPNMAEVVHRKCTRIEWADNLPAAPSPSTAATGNRQIINNVVSGALGAIEKRAFLVGGVNPRTGRTVCQSLEYDMTSKQWSSLGTWFPAPICDAPMVSGGSTLVLFGGWDDVHVLGDLWVATNKVDDNGGVVVGPWRRVAWEGAGPSPRRGQAMVATPVRDDGKFTVYMFGGFDGLSRLNDLWALDVHPTGGEGGTPLCCWTPLPSTGECPSGRDACAFALDLQKQRLVLFGGFTVAVDQGFYTYDLPPREGGVSGTRSGEVSAAPTPVDAPSASDGVTTTAASTVYQWTKRAFPVIPSRRQHCFGACSQHYFLIMFGHDGKQILSQVCQLHMNDGKWSLVAFDGDEVEPRLTPSVCSADGGKKILVFGGQGPKGKYFSSMLELELEKCESAALVKGKK